LKIYILGIFMRGFPIYGADGLRYGWEWARDGFDRQMDGLLAEKFADVPRNPSKPRVALDIGCGQMHRASQLSCLGLFDRVIGIDIGDRSVHAARAFGDAAAAIASGMPAAITPMQANVCDLNPKLFEDADIGLINFRRALHFLSPPDVRRALKNIRAIASGGATLALSFDADPLAGKNSLPLSSDITGARFYRDGGKEKLAAFVKYRPGEIGQFMEDIGFSDVRRVPFSAHNDLRVDEACFIAHVPPQAEKAVLRPALLAANAL
jgi:hypothetical protein